MSFGGLLASALGQGIQQQVQDQRAQAAWQEKQDYLHQQSMDPNKVAFEVDRERQLSQSRLDAEMEVLQRNRAAIEEIASGLADPDDPVAIAEALTRAGRGDLAGPFSQIALQREQREATRALGDQRAAAASAARIRALQQFAGGASGSRGAQGGGMSAAPGISDYEIEKEFESQIKDMDRRDMDDETLRRAYDLYRQGVDPRSGTRALTVREAIVEAGKGTSGVASTGFHPDMAGGDSRAMLRNTTRLGEGGRMLNSSDARHMSPEDIHAYVQSRVGKLNPEGMDGGSNPDALEAGLLASLTNTPINEMQGLLARPAPAQPAETPQQGARPQGQPATQRERIPAPPPKFIGPNQQEINPGWLRWLEMYDPEEYERQEAEIQAARRDANSRAQEEIERRRRDAPNQRLYHRP